MKKLFGSLGLTFLAILQIVMLVLAVTSFYLVDGQRDYSEMVPILILAAGGLVWSLLFGVTVVISVVRQRQWKFLAVVFLLVAFRCIFLWYEEAHGGGAEDHFYIWFPLEAFAYFLVKYPIALRQRFMFFGTILGIYGIQCVLVVMMLLKLS